MSSIVKKSEGELLIKQFEHALLEKDMTKEELAKKSGVPIATLYRWWKKPGRINFNRATKIGRALGIPQIIINTKGTYYI